MYAVKGDHLDIVTELEDTDVLDYSVINKVVIMSCLYMYRYMYMYIAPLMYSDERHSDTVFCLTFTYVPVSILLYIAEGSQLPPHSLQ